MRSSLVSVVITTVLCAAAAVSAADLKPGEAAYRRYCSACHGMAGKGDGVVGGLMTPRPADLTVLAKNNGGTFPTLRVINIIDGRETLRAHGESEMPVWGEVFTRQRSQATNARAQVRGQVQEITSYLQSIQQQ
ncbi:cytochrome c [bacterium]|nr:cytochrome c [bacterium]